MTANNVRARLNVGVGMTDWLAVDGSYNLVPRWQDDEAAAFGAILGQQVTPAYRIDDLRASLWPVRPGADDNLVVLQNLDRLFVTLTAPWFDLYLGRQAIAWGSARSVNPTDVIAPYLYTEIDTEDRIGVDAARLRIPVGALGEIDAGYVAGADAEWDNSAAYVRGKGYGAGIDYSIIAMTFRRHLLLGIDATFPIRGAGVWIEAAGVELDSDRYLGPNLEDNYARLTAGFDYSFRNATYIFLEYHYNGAGVSSASAYSEVAASPAVREGGVYLLGRNYLVPGVAWPVTPLWNLGGTILLNFDDNSWLAAPTLEFNALENVYLAAGAFVGFGDQPEVADTAFTGPESPALLDPGALEFHSEFGAYSDTWFVSARYYF